MNMNIDTMSMVLRESERLYLGRENAILPGQDFLRRHILYPALMITKGFDFAKKEFWIHTILYTACLFFALFFISEIPKGFPPEVRVTISSTLFYLIMIIPTFVILFLPPSTYSDSRIRKKDIIKLLDHIPSDKIDILEALFNIHNVMVEKRTLFLKRLYGISWAIFLYFFNLMEKAFTAGNVPIENDVYSLGYYILGLIVGFLLIHAYSKSAETILVSVRVALIEKKGV